MLCSVTHNDKVTVGISQLIKNFCSSTETEFCVLAKKSSLWQVLPFVQRTYEPLLEWLLGSYHLLSHSPFCQVNQFGSRKNSTKNLFKLYMYSGVKIIRNLFVLAGEWVKLLELCVLFPVKPVLQLLNSQNPWRPHNVRIVLCHTDKLLAPPAADSDGESDGSDRVPVPSFQNSFSQAFEKALLQLDNGPASPPQPVVEPGLEPIKCIFTVL